MQRKIIGFILAVIALLILLPALLVVSKKIMAAVYPW